MKLELFAETDQRTPLSFPHFPTRLQAVVWRNWGLIAADKLAFTLRATVTELEEIAEGLGLPVPEAADPLWLSRGYITILRANWHLLPYEQLLVMLDWTEEQMAFALKEDDFLWIKMGSLKPAIEPVYYRPLTDEEREKTELLRATITRYFPGDGTAAPNEWGIGLASAPEKPFAFLDGFRYAGASQRQHEASSGGGTVPADSEDKVVLNGSTSIVLPENASGRVRTFAERFADKVERDWGLRLRVADGGKPVGPDSGVVQLKLAPDAGKLRESHRIAAEGNRVTVEAVDENGLLRGLQWIASGMNEQGGPFVARRVTNRSTRYDFRLLYSYFAVYGDPLLDPELDPYPEHLLESLSETGVNAVWLQCVLYQLVPFAEAPEMSTGWERRVEGLRRLAARAADYGIGIYLYFNEPRSMPLEFFDARPDWKGHTIGTHASMCTSHPEVQRYLKEGTAALFRSVPELAGLFTITMSENMTNCYSVSGRSKLTCPRCSERTSAEVVAEVNRLIAEGAHSAKPDARIVCWTWGWREVNGFDLERCISLLPKGVSVMSVSEDEKPTNVGGVPGQVVDYSISQVGPGDKSRKVWKAARRHGLQAYAKVQFNNTWECSAVPFLPVFDLVNEHIGNLNEEGVSGLMLSWTLGGYPSPTLEMASRHYWTTGTDEARHDAPAGASQSAADAPEAEPAPLSMLRGKFGYETGSDIARATTAFSEAFRHFPFHVSVVYTAPMNYGPGNLLHLTPTGYNATMVGFPYDDVHRWRAIYPPETFEEQFRLLTEGWEQGLSLLIEAGRQLTDSHKQDAYTNLLHNALGAYYHFRSTYHQIAFVLERERLAGADDPTAAASSRRRMKELAEREIGITRQLYDLMRRDSRIGYEASNHYYYTARMLQEKVVNCHDLCEKLSAADVPVQEEASGQ